MNEMKRVLALLLCAVMLVGTVPVGAMATETETTAPSEALEAQVTEAAAAVETTEAAIETTEDPYGIAEASYEASSDDYLFVATDRHANTTIIGNIIDNMEANINAQLDYVALGGDMVGSGNSHPEYDSSTVLKEVTGAAGYLSAAKVDIVAGIHDMNVNDDAGIVLPYTKGGAQIYEGDRYYVYGVEEYCISEDSNESNWSSEADKFEDWAETVDTSKAIIVVSHYPLHAKRDDNDGAYYWHSALNDVATDDEGNIVRDIVFFHGHNHTVDSNEYVYNVGDTMSVQNGSSTKSEKISYTYATAGYLKQNSKATLVTVTDSTIYLDKYSTSGEGSAMAEITRVKQETTPAVTLSSIAISGTTEYTVGDALALTVTAAYSDGNTADVTADATLSGYDMSVAGDYTVKAEYEGLTAEYAITVKAAVEEQKTVSYMTISEGSGVAYVVGDAAVLYKMFVSYTDGTTGYVTQDDCTLTVYDESGNVITEAEALATPGTYSADVTYLGVTCGTKLTFTVDASGDSSYDLLNLVINGAEVTADVKDVTADVADAVAALEIDGYVAYDISATLAEGTTATVSVPVSADWAEGEFNVYFIENGVISDEVIEGVSYADGYVTFTAKHFSTYTVTVTLSDGTEIKTEGESATVEGTTTINKIATATTVYRLVTTPESGKTYLIVNSATGTGYGLDGDTAGYATTAFTGGTDYYASWDETTQTGTAFSTGDDVYLTTSGAYLWTAGSNSFSIGYSRSSSGFIVYSYSYSLDPDNSTSGTWSLSDNKLSISLADNSYSSDATTYYLTNSNSTWSMSTSGSNVYFYEPVTVYTVSEETDTTPTYTYTATGEDVTAAAIAGVAVELTSALASNPEGADMSGWTATYSVVTTKGDPAVIAQNEDGTYKIDGNVATLSGTVGTAVVKVTYTSGDLTAWDEFIVTANVPEEYTIQLHKAELTEVENPVAADIDTYYTYNSTTGVYEYALVYEEGTTYYTLPVIQGAEITEVITLKGVETDDNYSVWAVVTADGIDLGSLGDQLSWTVSDESIATIDEATGILTFTGENFGTFTVTVAYKCADGEVIKDTITISVTDSLYVVPGDGTDDFPEYPSQGAVRFDKTATAVGNFSETGIAKVELSMTGVPYSTGKTLDVLLMLDMSTSMDTEVATGVDRVDVTITAAKAFAKTILVNDDGSFTGNYIAIKYFNGSSVYTTTDWMTVTTESELEALYTKIAALYTPTNTGTYYSTAMENAYNTITARDAASDNTQALVFMSDGGPTYYTYLNDSGTGTVVSDTDGSTFVGWFDVDDNDTEDETDDTATANSSFETEYYSYLLKKANYPVYTVGLGLSTNDTGPSSYTGLTSGAHEAITSYILSSMATNSSYFYNIADSDAVSSIGNVFSAIAASIKEAATNVVVEDKVGSNYTVNFSLPTGITSDATDGIEDFYIQVVDYVLDSTTHERTGVYSVLENFTFDGETGALISHTVDGVTCTDCSHVTTTDGVITKIEGTYFTYEVKDDGEYLYWKSAKVSSTELALQYFAYLDNSAGTDVTNQIPAGTYYTNEYATLTYTNYNGNQVQQEFPVPQMTWNGAQVSYVFYLVNDAGQPVNRAGRVIPFAEAIYVTKVFTESVVWNDMEQSAGLEASYLAANHLPEVYDLYDAGASYSIHVYENETSVNLNNHFAIGSGYTGTWNETDKKYYTESPWDDTSDTTADELAYTTYVFNNKSDTTKYYVKGTYVADDGDTTASETGLSYFCKSAAIEGATYTTSVENDVTVYTVVLPEGVGYEEVEDDGETQTTVAEIKAAGGSTTGGTTIGDYIYYVDENGAVYTIVTKTDGTEVEKGFDFANTTVAFAVVWKPELQPDTVVVDYGLDVVIEVGMNDTLASGVVGVRTDAPSDITMNSGNYTSAKNNSVDVSIGDMTIGTATVENLTSVRFSLDKTNGMKFTDPAVFYYEADVNYYTYTTTDGTTTSKLNTTSMYSSVTVIPATTVYYEDSFIYADENGDGNNDKLIYNKVENGTTTPIYGIQDGGWAIEGTTKTATQAVDRPGPNTNMDNVTGNYDANNPYGFDDAYGSSTTWSMGSALKVNVSGSDYAIAEFDFYGTGFDLISLTDSTTGVITVKVLDENRAVEKRFTVDNYYGYAYGICKVTKVWDGYNEFIVKKEAISEEEKSSLPTSRPADTEVNEEYVVQETHWYPSTSENGIFQVPVIKASGLDWGKHTVRINVAYAEFFDHADTGSSNFYLDAIRIYDPMPTSTVIIPDDTTTEENEQVTAGDIYIADGEGFPQYTMVRDILAKAGDFDATTEAVDGVVFIDGGDTYSVADYANYGPNNEVYLTQNQAIAFEISNATNASDVQLGMKCATQGQVIAELSVYNGTTFVQSYGEIENTNSATDRYYSIGEYLKDIDTPVVVIKNTGTGILSITNIKATYETAPTAATEVSYSMSKSSANAVLMMLNAEPEIEEEPVVLPDAELEVSVNGKNVKVGNKITVKVTTSDAVESLSVNGEEVTEYKQNKKTGKRTWTVKVKAEEAGDMDIAVTAYSAEGYELDTVTETVAVAEKNGGKADKIIGQLLDKLFS